MAALSPDALRLAGCLHLLSHIIRGKCANASGGITILITGDCYLLTAWGRETKIVTIQYGIYNVFQGELIILSASETKESSSIHSCPRVIDSPRTVSVVCST